VKLAGKEKAMQRGYFGIGIYHTKTAINIGTLWRTAHNMGAAFIFTIGKRYKKQASDTTKASKHVPLYHYIDFEDFKKHMPHGCPVIAIEQSEVSQNIKDFKHPERAIYLLGAEDHGIPVNILKECHKTVHIDSPMCLNVAVAGSIVIYDRSIKTNG
jgi:tRNA (guanosine-2'-O-)-methyltransferase